MPRIGRIVAMGYPHHITQRGNYRHTVFIEDADYDRYLEWFEHYARKNRLVILAYCLMPNHVHFIAIPETEYSLARTFNACHMRYAQYFNKKRRVFGHLWQGRFYSCVLSESHLYAAIRYIENNPVRARLVKNAWDWKWSSAKYHALKEKSPISIADVERFVEINDWKYYLTEIEDTHKIKEIRANTINGRPLGNDEFVARMERIFHLRIRPMRRGRPRKIY